MDIYQERLRALRSTLAESGLDGCVLLPGANYYYYTGIHSFVDFLTTLLFIPAADAARIDRPTLILPDFEKHTTQSQIPFDADYVAYERDAEGYSRAFDAVNGIWDLGDKRLGVESIGFRYRELAELQRTAPSIHIEIADSLLMMFRLYKSPEEIESIRKAARFTESALDAMPFHIVAGVTEIELRNRFHIEALEAGAEGLGFDPLVVSGPRAALQHAAPSQRAIQRGDTVLFDVGARCRGYTADITRTFIVGEASEEVRSIYDVVRAANEAAFNAARPGVLASDVDAAARSVIEGAGYGETFIHGTGHGLGLEVHEPPRVASGSDVPLEPGMVFTIEPGVYINDRLGIRIEDDVLITDDGAERLTSFDHDLAVI